MKILANQSPVITSPKKNEAKSRPTLSNEEVKEKLAAHVELSKKSNPPKFDQALGAGFLNEKTPPASPPDHLLKTDVDKNDPNDSSTTEKLKSVLSKGAFSFNSREKEILDKILSDRN